MAGDPRRTVGPEGFDATWEQSYFGRGYPQQWSDGAGRNEVAWHQITGSAVDVTLLGRFYERFADHAVEISRRVIFQVTGRLPDEEEIATY